MLAVMIDVPIDGAAAAAVDDDDGRLELSPFAMTIWRRVMV